MTNTPEKTVQRVDYLAPALVISIVIAIFAVVTQLLDATGATSLSATQQLTMWLGAAGLIVLLWIAYMICRAYVTARSEKAEAEKARADKAKAEAPQAPAVAAEAERWLSGAKAATGLETKAAQEQIAQAQRDAEEQKALAEQAKAEAEAELARTAAAEAERRLFEANAAAEREAKAAQEKIAQAQRDAEEQKTRAEKAEADAEQARTALEEANVRLAKAAVGGDSPRKDGSAVEAREGEDAWAPPDELRHLNGSQRSVSTAEVFPHGCYLVPDSISPAVDKLTSQQVYQCRVVDPNPALKDRPHDPVVNILAAQKPSPPSGPRYALVEFEHLTLTITPYETDRSPVRMRYTLRATDIKPAVSADATAGSASAEVDTDRLVHDNTTKEGAEAPHQTAAEL